MEFYIKNGVLLKYRENSTHVVVTEGVLEIGKIAFRTHENIKSISFPEGMKKLDGQSIDFSTLEYISIPSSLEEITNLNNIENSKIQFNEYEDGLYLGNEENKYIILAKIIDEDVDYFKVNDNTRIIMSEVFCNCASLEEIDLGEVEYIGMNAFSGCKDLKEIFIPKSVGRIENGAFNGCTSLKIYAESKCTKEDWGSRWNPMKRPVVWDSKRS